MKSKRHTPEQVISKLAEGDKLLNERATVADVARTGCLDVPFERGRRCE